MSENKTDWAEKIVEAHLVGYNGIEEDNIPYVAAIIRQHCCPKSALRKCVKAIKLAGDPYCECEFQHESWCAAMLFREAASTALTTAKQYLP
jgi:hypothetical protein